MKSKNLTPQKSFYLTILSLLKENKTPREIQKILNISKQNLNYYLVKMKKRGSIIKQNGIWKVVKIQLRTPKKVRGHAFIWRVRIPKEIKGWNKRIEILKNNNITIKLVGIGNTPRVIINNRKVWLGNKSIVIFEPESFYGENAIQSKKYAVLSLLTTLNAIEHKLGINLHPYQFKPSREHYGLIKNDLAIQCNRKKEKIYVRDDLEGGWLWIDDSHSLGELETGGKKALVRNIQVDKWFNDHKKHDFQVTPSFLLESIKGLVNVQEMNAQNIIKHQSVLDEMMITLKKIQKNLENNH